MPHAGLVTAARVLHARDVMPQKVWLIVAVLLVACSKHTGTTATTTVSARPSSAPPPPSSAPAPPSGAPAPSASDRASPLTGVLSEEAFKRLHQLKSGSAPPRQGSLIQVGGERAYLSLPRGAKAPLPALVVVHEWWGLNEHIEHWADRLAEDGYAALAVDLYQGKVATTPDEAMDLMKKVDETRARTTLLAADHFLRTDKRVKASRLGAIGWCFGGRWALELALADPKLDAVVVYYGHVPTDPDKLSTLRTPVLAFFGKQDPSIPQAHVDAFEHALEILHVDHTVYRYDAGHAFANPSGARYNEQAAADAWKHVREFLDRRLKHPAH